MKLGDMTFDASRQAELVIIPEIETIRDDKTTADMFDSIFNESDAESEDADAMVSRIKNSRDLINRLIQHHYDSICTIFAALNSVRPEEIKQWKRSEVNDQIAEMFNDRDLISFFMSSETLALAAQSAISLKQTPSRQGQL